MQVQYKKQNNLKCIEIETRHCACGCGQTFECKINSNKRYLLGHNKKGKIFIEREERKCSCGCGKVFECKVNSNRKFFSCGHVNKNKKFSSQHKQKISKGNKNKIISKETRLKISINRKGKCCREKNVNWLGGISFFPYGFEFTKELKEKIRKRDNFSCRECGCSENNLKYKLSIHHIDYNKKNNKEDNLISLCKNCHSKTNYKRKDWISYFKNKLIGDK